MISFFKNFSFFIDYFLFEINYLNAKDIACSGSAVSQGYIRVVYEHSNKNCNIVGSGVFYARNGDVTFVAKSPSAPGFSKDEYFIFNQSAVSAPHTNCSIGSFSAASNISCQSDRTVNGTETATVSFREQSGDIITMTVSYTIAGGGAAYTINSASVNIPGEETSSSVITRNERANRALQASVSQSQTQVIGSNITQRIDATTARPSGAALGSEVPEQDSQNQSINFASQFGVTLDEDGEVIPQSRETSFRELMMMASFDTSAMVLSAAGDADPDGLRGAEQRRNLLTNTPPPP